MSSSFNVWSATLSSPLRVRQAVLPAALPAALPHYHPTTGQLFANLSISVSEHWLGRARAMLTPGLHTVSVSGEVTVETRIVGSSLVAVIRRGEMPVRRFWVVVDGRELGLALPHGRTADLPVPVCVVELLDGDLIHQATGEPLDVEKALAWVWVSESAADPRQQVCGYAA
jgi:hypothetical protein